MPRFQVIWDPLTVPAGPAVKLLKLVKAGRLSVKTTCCAPPPVIVIVKL